MRTELVRRHVAPEILALGVVELILTFTLALILVTPAAASFDFVSVHLAVMFAITVCFTAFVVGLYRPQIFERVKNLLLSTLLSALLSFPAVWIVSKVLHLTTYWPVGYDSLRPIKIVLVWSLGVLSLRLVFLAASRFGLFVHRVAVFGRIESPSVLAAASSGRKGFLEISIVNPLDTAALCTIPAGIRTLVISDDHELDQTTAQQLRNRGIALQSETEFWERYLRRVDVANVGEVLKGDLNANESDKLSRIVSRVFDLAVSSALLLATLPIIVTVALVVRFDSEGPVLYRQERVGLHNRSFVLLKFRSMRVDAEASGPRWAQQKDPRVTRFGSFMRRTRIDELPQLLNILRGEMSFIGPRPERPHFVEQLSKIIPNYHERCRVKPGLTGWAQVNYPYGASVEDARAKLSYDLYYVKNRTLLLDLLILLSTVRVILLQEGAR